MKFILPDEMFSEGEILIDYEDIDPLPLDEEKIADWIRQILSRESRNCGTIQYVLCDDAYLQEINWEHLKHKSLTDIISFEYGKDPVSGDIFISAERVGENARTFGVSLEQELLRVMAHGVLHFCGYKDKSAEDQALMREREDQALALWSEMA